MTVTRYLDVGIALAQRVRAGELPPGAELPTVRDGARAFSTTATTITRAYRYLAEGGVITLADRRPARVATDGALAAARLLEADRVFRVAGSDDPALRVLLDHLGSAVASVGTGGSFWALRMLHRGEADGAAIHLRHRSGPDNEPFARALLRGHGPHLVRLWRREQGLVVPPGNPRGLRSVADLADLRVARRETGAGTRVLLDQLLLDARVTPEQVFGPDLQSHLETGLAVAAGVADVALGLRPTAEDLALDFVSVTWESFDLVLPVAALSAAQPLVRALVDHHVRTSVCRLGGYDLADSGQVVDLSHDAACS